MITSHGRLQGSALSEEHTQQEHIKSQAKVDQLTTIADHIAESSDEQQPRKSAGSMGKQLPGSEGNGYKKRTKFHHEQTNPYI